jgi:hypothetical protein
MITKAAVVDKIINYTPGHPSASAFSNKKQPCLEHTKIQMENR